MINNLNFFKFRTIMSLNQSHTNIRLNSQLDFKSSFLYASKLGNFHNNIWQFEMVENYSSNKLAIALAVVLHLALFFSFFLPSKTQLIKQTIAISLVAKSSIAQNSKTPTIFKNSLNESAKAESKVLRSVQKSSTGDVSQDSLNQNSFSTKAIYDAKELNNPSPVYPELARSRGIEGKVVLKVMVNENGLVDDVAVFNSSGSSMLDLSALETVKNWHFIPAKSNNKSIRSQIMVPIVFKII